MSLIRRVVRTVFMFHLIHTSLNCCKMRHSLAFGFRWYKRLCNCSLYTTLVHSSPPTPTPLVPFCFFALFTASSRHCCSFSDNGDLFFGLFACKLFVCEFSWVVFCCKCFCLLNPLSILLFTTQYGRVARLSNHTQVPT